MSCGPGRRAALDSASTTERGSTPHGVHTMSIADTLLPEFDQEMATTRKLIERVPSDKATSKPHEKSFSLGHLTQLIARMPGWFTWSLTHGDQVVMTLPRAAVVRQTMSHLVRHRGPLSVYLRLVDVPLPSIYGPTADEKWG